MTGLILAAGNGTRLSQNNAHTVCKALVQAGGKPLIAYALDCLAYLSVDRAVIVVGKQHDDMKAALGETYRGIALRYAVQETPVGLVNAMCSAKGQIEGDVALLLSDEIFLQPQPAQMVRNAFSGADFLVGYTPDSAEKIRQNFSLETDENGVLLHCTEKPKQVFNNKKGTGFCLFSAACFALLQETYDADRNEPCELCDFLNLLIDRGKRGVAVPVAAQEININTPADLQYARACLETV